MRHLRSRRHSGLLLVLAASSALAGGGRALLGACGPFGDVSDAAFCPFVLEIFYLGITNGTTPTTYSPDQPASRLQAAAFLSRAVDTTLERSSRRTLLGQFWTSQQPAQSVALGDGPLHLASDGTDLWVAVFASGRVWRIRASDTRFLGGWGTPGTLFPPFRVLVAMGRIFVSVHNATSDLYRIDPSQPPGAPTKVATGFGSAVWGLAFDGGRIWAASPDSGSVSMIWPGPTPPWFVSTVTAGFMHPKSALYDGANVWISDSAAGLLRLDSAGQVLQTVTAVGEYPVFDGANIWQPAGDRLYVVRASTGVILATLTGNGLSGSLNAAFDGQRILVTNSGDDSVSLWNASNLSPLGSFSTGPGSHPYGVCSDGTDFWITMTGTGRLARF